MITRAFFLMAAILAASVIWADEFSDGRANNWHQWRGPLGSGVAPHGNPPTEWSETKNIKWKVEIPGQGSASPVVWGDRIFVLTAIKTDQTAEPAKAARRGSNMPVRPVALESVDGQGQLLAQNEKSEERPEGPGRGGEGRGRGRGGPGGRGGGPFNIAVPTNVYKFEVLCIDRQTGKTIWQRTAAELVPHEGHHQTGSFASASPITDGKHLWASFGSRGIYCYDLDGNQIWAKDLGDMRTRFSFGEGASPALHDNTLVLVWDHEEEDFIVALDALTGEEKWRTSRDEPSTWATPLIVEAAGRTQVITSGDNAIRSYDLDTGKLIWECGGLGSNPIATPVVLENLAIVMSGHREPAGIAVPLDAEGDVTGSEKIVWQIDEITSYIASPILYDELLYMTKGRDAILSSVDAKSGEVVIKQQRLLDQNTLYASPVGAAGRIYFPSREGLTVVIKHGRNFEVLARNPLDETIDATPAIVGDTIYIRGDKHLYCIAEK